MKCFDGSRQKTKLLFVRKLLELTQLLFNSSDLLTYKDNNNLYYMVVTNVHHYTPIY